MHLSYVVTSQQHIYILHGNYPGAPGKKTKTNKQTNKKTNEKNHHKVPSSKG